MSLRIIKKIILDANNSTASARVIVKQGCIGTIEIRAVINNKGGVVQIPSGTIADIRMFKPDKKEVLNPCSVDGNELVIDITSEMQSAPGDGSCEVILRKDGKTFVTATFYIKILANVHDDSNIGSSDEYVTILNALDRIDGAIEQAETAYNKAYQANELLDSAQNTLDQYATAETGRVIAENTRRQLYDHFNGGLNDLQSQINHLIIESGNSSPEVAQARVDSTGKTFTTLKDRLDTYDHGATYANKAIGLTGAFVTCPNADDGLIEILGIAGPSKQEISVNSPSPEFPSTIFVPNNFDIFSVGENLFDYSSMLDTLTYNGITYTKAPNGGIKLQGAATEFSFISFPIYLPAGTYTKRNNGNATYGANVGTNLRDKSNSLIDSSLNDTTITTVNPIHYLRVFVNAGVSIDDIIYITINRGNVPKPFSPFESNKITVPYELGDLPDGTKNEITLIDGRYKYFKRFGKISFDGSADESWIKQATGVSGRSRFTITVQDKKIGGMKNSLRCNRLDTADYNLANPPSKPSISGHTSANTLNVFGTIFDTMSVEQFKSWLSSHPVEVHYPLAVPVVTNADDIKPFVLKSYKGTSHLISNADPQINLTANFKSQLWSDMYKKDQEIEQLKNAIIAMGGTLQ